MGEFPFVTAPSSELTNEKQERRPTPAESMNSSERIHLPHWAFSPFDFKVGFKAIIRNVNMEFNVFIEMFGVKMYLNVFTIQAELRCNEFLIYILYLRNSKPIQCEGAAILF